MKTTKTTTILLAATGALIISLLIIGVQLTSRAQGLVPRVATDTCLIMNACVPIN